MSRFSPTKGEREKEEAEGARIETELVALRREVREVRVLLERAATAGSGRSGAP